MDEDLSLVVDRAPSVKLTFANVRLERRRLPGVDGIDGLYVMMPVDEQGRLARRVPPLREHRGMPGGGKNHHPIRSSPLELSDQMLGALSDVVHVLGRARNRGNFDPLDELAHGA